MTAQTGRTRAPLSESKVAASHLRRVAVVY